MTSYLMKSAIAVALFVSLNNCATAQNVGYCSVVTYRSGEERKTFDNNDECGFTTQAAAEAKSQSINEECQKNYFGCNATVYVKQRNGSSVSVSSVSAVDRTVSEAD